MTKANIPVRVTAQLKHVKMYEIAKELGISEFTFARKMREELSPEDKQKALNAIEKLSKKGE